MCKFKLKSVYENVTGLMVLNTDFLQHVCSFCGTMLYKFNEFKEKCNKSQRLLEMLVKEHILVTKSQIEMVNLTYNLSQPFTIAHFRNNIISTETDTNIVTKNFSIITVKDENSVVKIENDFDDFTETNFNIDLENDSDFQNDSDEEPLSKKVKKKKKKAKLKHKGTTKLRNKNIDIKTEDCQIFPIDQNCPMIDHNFASNEKNFVTNEQNFATNEQNFVANEQNFATNEHNFATDNQNYPTNNFNQALDLETDHKLVILSKQEQIDEILSRKTSANYMNSEYKCENCYKGFMTETTYKNHMARHELACGPIVCPICATRWPDARALRAHTLISHERYTCRACGHISKSRHKAAEHARWHAGAVFSCACGRRFARSTSYLTHVRLRHATHACDACGQAFIGENGLNMHKKKAHREKSEGELFECIRCKKRFKSASALTQHCDVTDGECDDTLHVCLQCGDNFSTDLLLKEHTDFHAKTDAVRTCTECSRSFAHERSLAAHVRRAHSRAQPHAALRVCEVCGYKCMSASSLVNHQRVHSGDKPHACPHCHKRFSVAQRLQIHVRTHTGERPFQCTRCPKAFKHKAALNRHDRVHTGVKPYSCPQCGKRFSQSNSMKQHCAGVHMKTAIYSRKIKQ